MNTEPVVQTPYLRLLEARAPTLSGRSAVRYAVFADPARTGIFLTIVANEGGGNWNKEVVAFSAVEEALAGLPPATPFPSKALRPAFLGRSANNAGFLAAALVEAGLLAPAPEAKHKLVRTGDWAAWTARMLAREGEPILFPPSLPGAAEAAVATVEPASAEPAPVEAPVKKNRRGGNRLIPIAPADGEEASNADPA